MKKIAGILFLFTYLLNIHSANAGGIWQRVYSRQLPGDAFPTHPREYLLYTADEVQLKAALAADVTGTAKTLQLPMADGTFRAFKISRSSVLPPALAAKYPGLTTYNAVAADNPAVTAKLDFTVYGFHAMIFDGSEVCFIDPGGNDMHGYYAVHYKRDETRSENDKMKCLVPGEKGEGVIHRGGYPVSKETSGGNVAVSNGYDLRTYRLALSCDHQYAQTVTGASLPSKSEVLSKMTTTMNRVNGIYERELSVTMVFVNNEDTLIFPSADGDPFGDNNNLPGPLLETNQLICDSLVGTHNYDIGHIFSTGAGGLSQLGVVCDSALKAQSVTGSAVPNGDGFDIDYVAHEMGHEFGSQHTFNDNSSSFCAGNAVAECAYEPGSGSTIMCYAGICNPDNIQPHSDAYFCASSLMQIKKYMTTAGDGCAVKTPTNNKIVYLPPFTSLYTIPYLTPFELVAPQATDSVGFDSLISYCWEEWDLGDFGKTLDDTRQRGPLFRSFTPVRSLIRTFPSTKLLRAGIASNAGVNDSSGEKLPDVSRTLNFKLTVRNIYNGYGCFLIPGDSIHINVINTESPFKVTSQATDGIVYLGKTTQQVTWNVGATNADPINDSFVTISMSGNGGADWAYDFGIFPNTGSATVMLPNPEVSIAAARFKVKAVGNVFFSINGKDFRVDRNFEAAVHMYPLPARDVLHIATENSGYVDGAIFNAVGQRIWTGGINAQIDLPVAFWARGIYIVKLMDAANRPVVRKIVLE